MDIRHFYINAFGLQDEALLDELVKHSEYKKVKKGTALIKEGEVEKVVPFLYSGAFQGICSNEDEKEFVDCIVCDFGEAVMGTSYFGQPSTVTLKALFASEVVCIPIPVVQELLERHSELRQLYLTLSLKAVEKHRAAKQMLLQGKTLESKYEWFSKNYSQIVGKVPDKTLASFFGVTAEWYCNHNPNPKPKKERKRNKKVSVKV